MDGLSSIEMLEPEVQTQILSHLSSVASLYSLIRASPRFYQVFKSRREYHLTMLAVQHTLTPANIWDTVKASRLPTPLTPEHVTNFTQTFMNDESYKSTILPSDLSIAMIRLNSCLEWFIADISRDTLSNLTRLGDAMDLKQEYDLVHSPLSNTEKHRISRALCRYSTYHYVYPPVFQKYWHENEYMYSTVVQAGTNFLEQYSPDEVEEVVCVMDYLERRLEALFDQVEDDYFNFLVSKPIDEVVRAFRHSPEENSWDGPDDKSWFGRSGKIDQDSHISYMKCLGLPFLRRLFTADGESRTQLVLSNHHYIDGKLEQAVRFLKLDALLNVSEMLATRPQPRRAVHVWMPETRIRFGGTHKLPCACLMRGQTVHLDSRGL